MPSTIGYNLSLPVKVSELVNHWYPMQTLFSTTDLQQDLVKIAIVLSTFNLLMMYTGFRMEQLNPRSIATKKSEYYQEIKHGINSFVCDSLLQPLEIETANHLSCLVDKTAQHIHHPLERSRSEKNNILLELVALETEEQYHS